MTAKYLKYFLLDGTPTGRIKCSLGNWTGVAYKIPRAKLVECKNIDYLKQSGVYFLFCYDGGDKPIVYVGQAGSRKNGEGILNRLREHHANPKPGLADWYEAIAFTTSNNTFGATEISWLENRFFALATAANRYDAQNSIEPNAGNVIEEIESELEEYVDYAKIVMGVLGHYVFDPLVEPTAKSSQIVDQGEDYIELFMEQNMRNSQITVKAFCKRTSEGFVVLKGSLLNPIITESTCSGIAKQARQQSRIDSNYILQEDFLFKSSSSAAEFVTGASANGLIVWKTRSGKTLKDIQASEAATL
jgi:hypothetical protein